MKLSTLLKQCDLQPFKGADPYIEGLSYDSRTVRPHDLFFAFQGATVDGHDFLKEAKANGATAAVVEKSSSAPIPQIQVGSVMETMARISHVFYSYPSHHIPVIGVTGTNGKTTVTYLIEDLIRKDGKKCGVMGTINYRMGPHLTPAPNTTPQSMDVHQFIARNIQAKSDVVVMEVSSHALDLHRVDFVKFKLGVFMNLTQDHLDFHKDMESYFRAKSKLFSDPSMRAVINGDDSYGKRLLTGRKIALSFGFDPDSLLRASHPKFDLSGIQFQLSFPSGKTYSIRNNLMGQHNIYNCLAAAGTLIQLGFSETGIVEGLNSKHSIPGRLERVDEGQDFVVVVDYAHTHDAMANALSALREAGPKRLLCLFGAGGDRDRTKRPKMGKVGVEMADFSYVTSDNPRTEDPQKILQDIEAGIKETGRTNYEVVADRKEAIQKIIQEARKGDIVLLAGKGHEDYQVIGTQKIHFSDQEVARDCLKK
jgi:UDP-N-acetylmuramoyl-L-alanyl-D-glutamate--2,6-diaminopimelate ligase